jgi:hypothetical protein
LGVDFRQSASFAALILEYRLFVKLTGDNLIELRKNDARMGVICAETLTLNILGYWVQMLYVSWK